MRLFQAPRHGPLRSSSVFPFLVFISVLLSVLLYVESISITTVYAGKKKFKSYNLGFSFLPTLVKVKPNRLALSFRHSRYIRPPKFKIEGSIPFKIPTIIMEKPDPYAKPQIININKNIKLGQEMDQSDGDYKAAGTDEQTQVQESPGNQVDQSNSLPEQNPMTEGFNEGPQMEPPFSPPPFMYPPFEAGNSFPMMPPMLPLMAHNAPYPVVSFPNHDLVMSQLPSDKFKARSQRTRRSLNLHEPYHHHLSANKGPSLPPFILPPPPPYMEPIMRPIFPSSNSFPFGYPKYGPVPVRGPFPPPPRANFFPHPSMWPMPWQSSPMSKQDNIPEQQHFLVNEANPPMSVTKPVAAEVNEDPNQPRSVIPMKINIGEHYNPNQVYMDESIVPNLEDVPLIDPASLDSVEEPVGEESSYQQHYHKPGYNKQKDAGPDDFRVSFSFSGVHGGPLVPLGTGDNIDQYYKQLKKFEGNNLPVGLPPEQLYKYYRAHTFTDGFRVYRTKPAKVIRAKLIEALLG